MGEVRIYNLAPSRGDFAYSSDITKTRYSPRRVLRV